MRPAPDLQRFGVILIELASFSVLLALGERGDYRRGWAEFGLLRVEFFQSFRLFFGDLCDVVGAHSVVFHGESPL